MRSTGHGYRDEAGTELLSRPLISRSLWYFLHLYSYRPISMPCNLASQ